MQRRAMGRAAAAVLALVIIAVATPTEAAAGPDGEVKCGGCSPCGSDCPVVYPSPPPPSPPPPEPYYYYSPPPPYYPGVSYCPPPPAPYLQVVGTPAGLYPQDPGFLPSSARRQSRRAAAVTVCALSALVGMWAFW